MAALSLLNYNQTPHDSSKHFKAPFNSNSLFESRLPHKDYPGSLWTLFLGIVGSVIATYIADGRAAKAAIWCWISYPWFGRACGRKWRGIRGL